MNNLIFTPKDNNPKSNLEQFINFSKISLLPLEMIAGKTTNGKQHSAFIQFRFVFPQKELNLQLINMSH
jgi:hypothetical protein